MIAYLIETLAYTLAVGILSLSPFWQGGFLQHLNRKFER